MASMMRHAVSPPPTSTSGHFAKRRTQRRRLAVLTKIHRGAANVSDRLLHAGGDRTVICCFSFGKAALQNVSVDKKIYGIRIARIERNCRGEIAFRFRPLTAPAFDVTGKRKK